MHRMRACITSRLVSKRDFFNARRAQEAVQQPAGLCRLGIRLSASPVWCGAAHLNSTCTGPWPCTPCAADRIPGYALCLLSIRNPFAQQATTPAEVKTRKCVVHACGACSCAATGLLRCQVSLYCTDLMLAAAALRCGRNTDVTTR